MRICAKQVIRLARIAQIFQAIRDVLPVFPIFLFLFFFSSQFLFCVISLWLWITFPLESVQLQILFRLFRVYFKGKQLLIMPKSRFHSMWQHIWKMHLVHWWIILL